MLFHDKFAHIFTCFWKDLMVDRAHLYAKCMHERGAALENYVVFMDGTKIQISLSGGCDALQSAVYSGHKHMHCFLYQTITTPDGLKFRMYGTLEGRRIDALLYRESQIDTAFEGCLLIDGAQFYLYADRAYVLRPWIPTAFSHAKSSEHEPAFKKSMNKVRSRWNEVTAK